MFSGPVHRYIGVCQWCYSHETIARGVSASYPDPSLSFSRASHGHGPRLPLVCPSLAAVGVCSSQQLVYDDLSASSSCHGHGTRRAKAGGPPGSWRSQKHIGRLPRLRAVLVLVPARENGERKGNWYCRRWKRTTKKWSGRVPKLDLGPHWK